MFHSVGERLFWQPQKFPADPELISFGNNVNIAANVTFINHDTSAKLLNDLYQTKEFKPVKGCIEIGNNILVGANVIILPNVRIGNNVVIGAGSIVAKDIPDNCVAAGVPCKVIDTFDNYAEKRRKSNFVPKENLWEFFIEQRQ